MKPTASLLPALFVIVTLSPALCLSETSDDDWWQSQPEERALQVNSGQLELMPSPPAQPVHHHQNRIVIDGNSLEDGWIGLRQCHEHLDAVARSEVTFREGGIRNLRITAADNVGRARVEGASVQLWDVGKGARLCLTAESRALHRRGERYVLRNGPYMRRFLDGYYPMHVTLSVQWPARLLALDGVSPAPQPGLTVTTADGRAQLDTWFRGRLVTELSFSAP